MILANHQGDAFPVFTSMWWTHDGLNNLFYTCTSGASVRLKEATKSDFS